MKIAVFCVGNRLMLDEGIGPAVYDELVRHYEFSGQTELYDVGCMSMDMIHFVRDYDYLISVDAIDGTDAEPGTIFRFHPDDIQRPFGTRHSLHDMRLTDLFDSASLLGYETKGLGFGMQVENLSPGEAIEGLTPKVFAALPQLVDTVLAELSRSGVEIRAKCDGRLIDSTWQHCTVMEHE